MTLLVHEMDLVRNMLETTRISNHLLDFSKTTSLKNTAYTFTNKEVSGKMLFTKWELRLNCHYFTRAGIVYKVNA